MRRLWPACVVALAALAVVAPARADLFDSYQRLASRNLRPAPLVFTTAPRAFRPIASHVESGTSVRRSGYGMRLLHFGPGGVDGVVAISGGDFRTIRAALRFQRRDGFHVRRTRIRGHRGY